MEFDMYLLHVEFKIVQFKNLKVKVIVVAHMTMHYGL